MYGSYLLNVDFNDLPIEYKQRLFTKQPIDRLTNDIVEKLKVSSIRRSFHNIIYESNPQNSDFYYLPFDGDERSITRRRIYRIRDDILFMLNNSSSVDV